MNLSISGIILAAGNGKRFGGKKQFIEFMGKPVWKFVKDTVSEVLEEVIVVGVDIKGGKTRQESVLKGIRKAKNDKIIIFDAARPLVTKEQIYKIALSLKRYNSVSFAVDSADTIYYKGDYIRKGAYLLQVPQAFDRRMLLQAHLKTEIKNATDDTVIFLKEYGVKPKIIKGGKNLHKLTVKEDLNILKAL